MSDASWILMGGGDDMVLTALLLFVGFCQQLVLRDCGNKLLKKLFGLHLRIHLPRVVNVLSAIPCPSTKHSNNTRTGIKTLGKKTISFVLTSHKDANQVHFQESAFDFFMGSEVDEEISEENKSIETTKTDDVNDFWNS
jgi:hypothetical protein